MVTDTLMQAKYFLSIPFVLVLLILYFFSLPKYNQKKIQNNSIFCVRTTKKAFAFLFIAFFVLISILGIYAVKINHINGGLGTIDSSLFYTIDDVHHILDPLRGNNLGLYKSLNAFDMLFALCYPFLISFILLYCISISFKNPSWKDIFVYLPFLVSMFDLTENAFVASFLYIPESITQTNVGIVSTLTLLKFISISIVIILVLAVLFIGTLKNFKERKKALFS